MKPKTIMAVIMTGVILFTLAAFFLSRILFTMPITPAKTPGIEQPATAPQKILTDKTIEVGNDTDEKKRDIGLKSSKVAQHSSAQPGRPEQPAETPALETVGKVVYLSGSASILSPGGKARLLAINADISQMDRIETGPGTKLEIKFTDDTVISQGEKSIIVIEECIYAPSSPASCSFTMRFIRGVCRVITGFITDINPERFKVKARLATAGIRGCDLVFKSSPAKDDIYILDIGRAKSVEIETTINGTAVNNIITGRSIEVEASARRHISVTEPQTAVIIADGKGPKQRKIRAEESRNLIAETSHLAPARFELQQKPNGATLKIAPIKPAGKKTPQS